MLDHSVEAELINTETNVKLKFALISLVGNTYRVLIDEKEPLLPRYKVIVSLKGEPQVNK